MSDVRTLSLSPRDRRTLLLGALGIATILLCTRVAPRTLRWRHDVAERSTTVIADAARAAVAARMLPVLRDSLVARLVRRAELDSAELEAPSRPAAAAALAELVSDAAEETQVQLGSVRLESVADSGSHVNPVKVGIRASLTADLADLAQFLAAVERGPRLLAIRELSIAQPDMALPSDRSEVLRVELLIEALARIRGIAATNGSTPP